MASEIVVLGAHGRNCMLQLDEPGVVATLSVADARYAAVGSDPRPDAKMGLKARLVILVPFAPTTQRRHYCLHRLVVSFSAGKGVHCPKVTVAQGVHSLTFFPELLRRPPQHTTLGLDQIWHADSSIFGGIRLLDMPSICVTIPLHWAEGGDDAEFRLYNVALQLLAFPLPENGDSEASTAENPDPTSSPRENGHSSQSSQPGRYGNMPRPPPPNR